VQVQKKHDGGKRGRRKLCRATAVCPPTKKLSLSLRSKNFTEEEMKTSFFSLGAMYAKLAYYIVGN